MQLEDWMEWLSIATGVHNNQQNTTTRLFLNQILIGYNIPLTSDHMDVSTNKAAERQLGNMIE
jgi:hypothetical protein